MSSNNRSGEVDFDFFDDPPHSAGSSKSAQNRSRSPKSDRSVSRSRSRSRSRSSSTQRSRSRQNSARSRSRSRDSYSEDFSDNDSRHSDRSRSPSPAEQKTPVGSVVISNSSKKNKNSKHSNENLGYHSDSSADSDVTDVSPLNSPTEKRRCTTGESKKRFSPAYDAGDYTEYSTSHGKPPNSGKRRPASGKRKDSYEEYNDGSNNDSLNMQILMDVLDMEQEDPSRQEQLARSKRVLFVPPGPKQHGKKNFSFSNDQVDRIDKENQRLMEKIMRRARQTESMKNGSSRMPRTRKTKPVLTPSAVNRQRQQQKIEQENLAFLKRLQSTRATRTLRRDTLLHDYQGKLIAGQSVAAAHTGARSQFNAYTDAQYSHSYSMSDITEPATVMLSNDSRKRLSRPTSASTVRSNVVTGSRPMSGKRRPQSAKVSNDWVS